MAPLHIELINSTLRRVSMRLHFQPEVIQMCDQWSVAYQLSIRNRLEVMTERTTAARMPPSTGGR